MPDTGALAYWHRKESQLHKINGPGTSVRTIESEQGVHEGVHHRGYILSCALFLCGERRQGMTITANGETLKLAEGTTLQAYLEDKGYNLAVIVCELNLKIIDRETYAEVILHDGDVLEVVSFVGGG
jgi:sulfur carrier protein